MVKEPGGERTPIRNSGSQTLARGLTALQMITDAPEGLSVHEISERLGAHRTIAYRLLGTLAEFHLITRGADGRYRAGAGTVALARNYQTVLRDAALPVLRRLADELGSTVSLLVAELDEAVAIAVVAPQSVDYHLAFREGSRHPLHRGAAGRALSSLREPAPTDAEAVVRARRDGYAITHGEVEPGAYGLSVPLPLAGQSPPTCINVITYREGIVKESVERVRKAAEEIARAVRN